MKRASALDTESNTGISEPVPTTGQPRLRQSPGTRAGPHFTTQVSQAKETNSVVDIGLQCVVTDANGNPLDFDGEELADHLADRNGDGDCVGDTYCCTSADTDSDGLNDSDEYDLSQNLLVNNPLNDYGNEQSSQWQPKVVALGDTVVVGSWDSNQGVWGLGATNSHGLDVPTPCRMAAWSGSVDGGRTLTDKGVPPLLQGEWGDAGDPVLAVDRASQTICYVATSERSFFRGVPLWKSVDKGMSFQRCPTIRTNIEYSDYPWITVGDWPGTGLTCM